MPSINQLLKFLSPVLSFTLLLFSSLSISPLIIFKRTHYEKALNYTEQISINNYYFFLFSYRWCVILFHPPFVFFLRLGSRFFWPTRLYLVMSIWKWVFYIFICFKDLTVFLKIEQLQKFRRLVMYNRGSVQFTNFKVHKKKNVYI